MHMDTPKPLEKNIPSPNVKGARKKSFLRTAVFYLIFLLVVIVAADTIGKLSESPEGLVSHNKNVVGGDHILLTSPHPASYAFSAKTSFFWLLVFAIFIRLILFLFERMGQKRLTSNQVIKLSGAIKISKILTEFLLVGFIASWVSSFVLKGYLLKENDKGVYYVDVPSIIDWIRL